MFYRIYAMVLRQVYLHLKSWWRMSDIFYWPVLDVLLWGFITLFLEKHPGMISNLAAFLLGALILWDILTKASQVISISFLEEIWSRNLLNLFSSPLSHLEFLASSMTMSLIKLAVSTTVSVFLCWAFFSFDLFRIGIYLFPFILNLVIMGWAIGILAIGFILRYGQKAEFLGWTLTFLFQPISAVFYPVEILPSFLQTAARFVPATHVFEGMREVLNTGSCSLSSMALPLLLNAVYLSLALLFFEAMFRSAQRKGLLVKLGE